MAPTDRTIRPGGDSGPAPRASTVCSVVVPAHNEAGSIADCLRALASGVRPGELEVVVVANGCVDDTASVARRTSAATGHAVTVLELPAVGKAAAVRAGDDAATSFPRAYLDADVVCTGEVVRSLAQVLDEQQLDLVAPGRRLDTSRASWAASAFHQTWSELPWVRSQVVGRGLYLVSRTGWEAISDMPDVVADDLYVAQALRGRTSIVEDAVVTVTPPRTLLDTWRVRTRHFRGNLELGSASEHREGHSTTAALASYSRRPATWPRVLVWAATTAAAKLAARSTRGRTVLQWERDPFRGGKG